MDVIVLPKSQNQDVIPPAAVEVLKSVKSMQSPIQIVESDELKDAIGPDEAVRLSVQSSTAQEGSDAAPSPSFVQTKPN